MSSAATTLKTVASRILPDPLFTAGKRLFLSQQARALRNRCIRSGDLERMVQEVRHSPYFRPDQRANEILGLMRLLATLRPHVLCEIGGRSGGSLALFARIAAPDARILSIDLDYRPGQREALSRLAGGEQTITCLTADSHDRRTREHVQTWLGSDEIDFLFIDGDHSLRGVSEDFTTYAAFVRDGGLIAFHDIVEDSFTRRGVRSGSDSGEVPRFWRDVKGRGWPVEEYVDDWNQDGFGLGVLWWSAPERTTT